MKSKNFSIRLSLEIYELLNKIALYTGMRKREIIEKAILEFAKNNYGELLSKDLKDVLKESIKKSIEKVFEKEREEVEKWKKVLLRFIGYHFIKIKLLYNYYYGPDAFNETIPKQLHTLKSYENSLTRQVLKLLPEVEDYKATSFIIKFVDEINRLNSIEIETPNIGDKWKIEEWELFKIIDKQLPKRIVYLHLSNELESIDLLDDPDKKILDKIKNYILWNLHLRGFDTIDGSVYKIEDIVRDIIINNLDYYFTPILENINKKHNTSFNSLSQLFEYARQFINKEAYMSEVIKIRKAVVLDFIKYLEEIKNIIKNGGLPKKKPRKFIINKTIEHLTESKVMKNFMLGWEVYNDLTKLITKEFMDKVIKEVETKVVNYLKERFKDRIIKKEYYNEVKCYYKIDEKDLEAIEEELKNVLFNSVKS